MFKSQYILLNNIKFPQRVRLTLDYKEDLELAERIFGELGTNFNIHQVSKLFIQKPELLEITKELIQIWEENYEKNRATNFINSLKEASGKINVVFVRASPIMEFLTGIMIACMIYLSAKLIANNELQVSNFFSFFYY